MRNGYKLSITTGLLLIAAALSLSLYNLLDEHNAAQAADHALEQILLEMPEPEPKPEQTTGPAEAVPLSEAEIPDYVLNPRMDMPVREIDDQEYVGTLEIPAIGLNLPVISQWSYPCLKIAPCRYTGSVYLENMTIAGHNYSAHFGDLKSLRPGDPVIFTDMDGNSFRYEAAVVETLQPTAAEEMTCGKYPLSLFTCTVGGQYRIVVRCQKAG